MKLNKFQLATVKNTVKLVTPLKNRVVKLREKSVSLQKEIEELEDQINKWENPLWDMVNGNSLESVIAVDGDLDKLTPEHITEEYAEETIWEPEEVSNISEVDVMSDPKPYVNDEVFNL